MHLTRLLGLLLTLIIGVSIVSAQTDSSLDGIWETNGYGLVLQIEGDTINVYEITSLSCLPWVFQPLITFGELQFTVEDNQLLITRLPYTQFFTAHRLEALPTQCENGGTSASDDPELNFEVFWNTFNEQYAFFELRGVDWQTQYETYRPQVTAETTADELFAILSDMIDPLDDGHVSIESENDDFSPNELPIWADSPMSYMLSLIGVLEVLPDHIGGGVSFDMNTGGFTGDESRVLSPVMFYGDVNDAVGYVCILGEQSPDGDYDSFAAAMDRVIASFADKQAVIVDVRINGGGEDAIALLIASRFADQERVTHTKAARMGDGLTPEREFTVTPGGERQFTGQTFLLTSGLTPSAGEILAMAMGTLPHVTIIGEPTNGIHSDILARSLPNGWEFGLSNEVYRAADGEIYEAVGIAPDILIPFVPSEIADGNDAAFDAAMALING